MKAKIKFIVLFMFGCIQMYATSAKIIIEPNSDNANGTITTSIKGIPPAAQDRLLLLSFHIQMRPNVPSNDTVPHFNGWYLIGEKNQLWIGDILKANTSDLDFKVEFPCIMHKNDKGLYELNLSINNDEGFHTFFPDSTEKTIIVPINQVNFKGGNKYIIEEYSTIWKDNGKSNNLVYSCKEGESTDLYVTCSIKEPDFMWILLIIVPLIIVISISAVKRSIKIKWCWRPIIVTIMILITYYLIIYYLIYPYDKQFLYIILGIVISIIGNVISSLIPSKE